MQVSIIIPSLNSPLIDKVLTHLRQQTAWNNVGEILVVGRDQLNLIRPCEKVTLFDTGEPASAPAARNLGIKASQYNLLLFLDSDCLPQPAWLAQHLTAQQAGHPVVGGGILPEGENYWSLIYNLTLFHEFHTSVRSGRRDYLPTLNLSVQRTVIDEVGELDEALTRGQDIEWTTRMVRAGYTLMFWPEAAVFHQHNRKNLGQVWQDCARSGYYMRQVRLKHKDILEAPAILNNPFLLLLLSPLIAAAVTLRILIKQPATFLRRWYTLPGIYLTKIAWCWGAFQE